MSTKAEQEERRKLEANVRSLRKELALLNASVSNTSV